MSALAGGARTPVCRAGGALGDVTAGELAAAAARAALEASSVSARDLGAIVSTIAVPGTAAELALASHLAAELGAGDALTLSTGGAADAGFGALITGLAVCAQRGCAVLVVGGDSATRAPLWSLVPRHRPGDGTTGVLDPVGALLATRGEQPPEHLDRAAQDAFAERSHRLARRPPAEPIVEIAGVTGDEPQAGDRSVAGLASLKPVFDVAGTVTAGNAAMPADGAAALVLLPDGDGPRFGTAPMQASTFEILETSAAAVLGRHPDAGEALNPAGGAIGQGLPLGCGALVMSLRLAHRLGHGESGLLQAGSAELWLSA